MRMAEDNTLIGYIVQDESLIGTISVFEEMIGEFSTAEPGLIGELTYGSGSRIAEYLGPYLAIPTAEIQLYDTKNKKMLDDFIKRILILKRFSKKRCCRYIIKKRRKNENIAYWRDWIYRIAYSGGID